MAPLTKVLFLTLLSTTLLASFFFVFSKSHTEHNPLGSRRIMLSTSKDDSDDDFLVEVIPRKKKSSSSNANDDDLLVKKTKYDTSPKKKKVSSSEGGELVMQQSKMKKSPSNLEEEEKQVEKNKKKSTTSLSSKNQTKMTKPKSSNLDSNSPKKDESKLVSKPSLVSTSSKNKTKLIKSKAVDDSSLNTPIITKLDLKKANETSKSSNSTKPKPDSATKEKTITTKTLIKIATSSQLDTATDKKTKQKSQNQDQKRKSPSSQSWIYQDGEDENLVKEFRDLPSKFHQSFIPDLHRISTTSKIYLTQYNKEITKGFKPYVGNKYAPSLATAISCAFIIIPFLLVSLVFNKIKAYFSLQKLIIFIQIYLSIYFTILCFSSLITGLEPLGFFYATSKSTYIWLQVLQTLGYVLYLLMLLMYLILVFSTESDMGQKFLGLGQTFVGFSVGLHYYMTVFHRVVLRQPPKTNWKIHGIYATCFLVICLFASAERRKKAYPVEGGEEGKTS